MNQLFRRSANLTRLLQSAKRDVEVLNTRSEYVQSNLQREGSYFQRMEHRETEALAAVIDEYIDSRREYILGITDEEVFKTDDPTEAVVLAISGSPIQ